MTGRRRISWPRALFHASGAVIPAVYLLYGKEAALFVTTTAFAMAVAVEALRIRGLIRLPLVEPLLKEKERRAPSGAFFYLASCLAAVLLFERTVACASILVLAVADPASAIVGSAWGRTSLLGKSAEGTATFFLASLLVLACFSFGGARLVIAACAATVAELASTALVDDNLIIPLATGVMLTVMA